jgi:hypothetical protein
MNAVIPLATEHTICAGCGRLVRPKRTYGHREPHWPPWLRVRYCARRCWWRASTFNWTTGEEPE